MSDPRSSGERGISLDLAEHSVGGDSALWAAFSDDEVEERK